MNISPADLAAEYHRAVAAWPFIGDVEAQYGLPPMLLFAVGSRETNLTDERGDGGHGHGVWQEDDRTAGRGAIIARIDSGDVRFAATIAAAMLSAGHAHYGDWLAACNAYNSGQAATSGTAGGDYGPDVLDRMRFLQTLAAPPPPQPEEDNVPLQAQDSATGEFWLCYPDGSVAAFDGTGNPGNRWLGGLNTHPDWHAGAGQPLGAPVGFAYLASIGGYVIVTRTPDGGYHPYRFPGDGSAKGI